ncbi:MAG TPA: glycine betaine ABC transporter substrate-binding protein [Bryobacteraceae bacterium]|jgi:osmoprotectant transport system substrate-binding protein
MSAKSSRYSVLLAGFVLSGLILLASACSRPKPIIVGSMSDSGQSVVAEIIAQHLEHTLDRKIARRLNSGNQMLAYQSVSTGDITLYPEFTGAIVTGILKETADANPEVVLERARTEMRRTAALELLDPLGFDNPTVLVVRASDAAEAKVKTLSDAAAGKFRWKLGVSFDFQQRPNGIIALNTYNLPMAESVRGLDANALFPALQAGEVTMISSTATDGHLTSPDFQILADDKHVFAPAQACILVRADALTAEPKLRAALAELSGKFTTEAVRKMAAQVDLDHMDPAALATAFLAQSGLK